jgi:glycosyltransferase involved in cell wall biosynthesis
MTDAGIHQILVAASPGDAITNMALGIRDILRRAGPSEIYARHVSPELMDDVCELHKYRSRHARNLLMFHASIGQPEVHAFLTSRAEALVLVYHNVTPGMYFEPYDLEFAELLALGRREVELLRPRVAQAIAASEFNARELEAMGYRDVRVVPPVIDFHRLAGVEPRESTLKHLRSLETPILLSVAQLMPHKRPDYLVEMMHCIETYRGFRPVLMLVGHNRMARYTRAIREQVRELEVNVHVVGAIDERDLVAMFQMSSAFVTASEHEGFCLPVIEAMAMSTPVIARACAAIPETVGNAALLVPASQGPSCYAEAVYEVLTEPRAGQELMRRGHTRVAEIERSAPDAAIVDALLQVA